MNVCHLRLAHKVSKCSHFPAAINVVKEAVTPTINKEKELLWYLAAKHISPFILHSFQTLTTFGRLSAPSKTCVILHDTYAHA